MLPSVMYKRQEEKWKGLCNQYLPIDSGNTTIWRQNREINMKDPQQGWKLHVSATIVSACSIFEKVAPLLTDLGVLFKAPCSLLELKKLNCGLYYGYSQIGKFITVYPRSEQESIFIAKRLHETTKSFKGPLVPSDLPFKKGSQVHYRYGSFKSLEVIDKDGKSVPAMITPKGDLVPDLREPGSAVPDWIEDPFKKGDSQYNTRKKTLSPLKITTLAYEAISQRGKSGVYRALDISVSPSRLCILKEGRKYGEVDWDNRDGYWRVKHESLVLKSLSSNGVSVPKVYLTFEEEQNYYLAMEFIEGKNLQSLLVKKIPIKDALNYGIQMAKVLHNIHSSGWVWRDCKPLNLILTKECTIRPLDFEGACPIESPDKSPWGTQGYVPPEWSQPIIGKSRLPEDLYALGASLHQIFSGQIPRTEKLKLIGTLRRGIPISIRKIISELLATNPDLRPSALTVVQVLTQEYLHHFGEEKNDYLFRANSSLKWIHHDNNQ